MHYQLEDLNYVVEAMIASEAYPDLVGMYWKGSLTTKAASSGTERSNKAINYRGVSIYRIQNGKLAETWHVVDGLPSKKEGYNNLVSRSNGLMATGDR